MVFEWSFRERTKPALQPTRLANQCRERMRYLRPSLSTEDFYLNGVQPVLRPGGSRLTMRHQLSKGASKIQAPRATPC